jgi:hypothetical protein
MSKQDGIKEAIKLAISNLENKDISMACKRLGFASPEGHKLKLRMFDNNMIFDLNDFSLTLNSGKPAKSADLLLLLHYFQSDFNISETGSLISFRDLPGGQFYLNPFLSRTVNPLIKHIDNDLDTLKKHLSKFVWSEVNMGDFAAKILAFGNLYITIVYQYGDEEFPASFDVFFDKCIKRAFSETEDAVVMASRICIGLLF